MHVCVPRIFKFTLVHACPIISGLFVFVCLTWLGIFVSVQVFASIYVSISPTCSAPRGQKKVLDPLELELQVVVGCQVNTGNWTWVFGKSSHASTLNLNVFVWMDSTEQQYPAQEWRKAEEIVFRLLRGQKRKQVGLYAGTLARRVFSGEPFLPFYSSLGKCGRNSKWIWVTSESRRQ